MKPGIGFDLEVQLSDPASWLPHLPNPADFRFNYFKLMKESQGGLAKLPDSSPRRVAVIGAGVAGMTVARELYRCGFSVIIYEASDRIGGRLYTIDNPTGRTTQAGMEMGAMRMPFFAVPGSNNSVLDYYMMYESASQGHPPLLSDFPNPGKASGGTGIYINQGHGPNMEYPSPQLISWPKDFSPDNSSLAALSRKVSNFGNRFSIPAQTYYTKNDSRWAICWGEMANYYSSMTFHDVVLAPSMSAQEITDKIKDLTTFDGNVGGFGMDQKEAELLYTIGTGDGSWGAFYSIGALWFLRCTFFGFDSNLQTVEGLQTPNTLPYYNTSVNDSYGTPIKPPLYQGIQSLVEYLYYVPAPGMSKSLHEGTTLIVNKPVREIRKSDTYISISTGGTGSSTVDFVVVTPTQWATQMSINFVGFLDTELPQSKITTEHIQHNISSCKLFFPLKEKYWVKEGNHIPQIIVTDTYIQDIYGLDWTSRADDKGVLLASYTWEDDSLKLLPFAKDELVNLVLNKLQEITTSTVQQDITAYVDRTNPVTIQWIKEPTYIGCSKLYRARSEQSNGLDLSYNQIYGAKSKLYFAGENYGVEGGWTEPALRSALDCVLQLLSHVSATFKAPAFDFSHDYPKWPLG